MPEPMPETVSSLITRACCYAWGPRPGQGRAFMFTAGAAEFTEADDRLIMLAAVMTQHMKDTAPRMDRSEAFQLGCLLLDLGLAVHKGYKFLHGRVRKSEGVDAMSPACIQGLVDRHCAGDWGSDGPGKEAETERNAKANEVALAGNGRLLSCFSDVRDGDLFWVKVWVMTDSSIVAPEEGSDGLTSRIRPATTVLLPSEY